MLYALFPNAGLMIRCTQGPSAKMPGLLQTPSGHFAEAKFVYALIAEFIGVMLFAFAGSATPQGNVSTQQSTMTDTSQQASGSANWAPWYELQCVARKVSGRNLCFKSQS